MRRQTEALKLALEALRDYRRSDDDRVSVAMGILQEALAEQPAQQQEPVAYIKTWHKNGEQHADIWQWEVGIEALKDGNHYLYTSPPASNPLTDEHIEFIRVDQEFAEWAISEAAFRYAARAIEAAHGIKENT